MHTFSVVRKWEGLDEAGPWIAQSPDEVAADRMVRDDRAGTLDFFAGEELVATIPFEFVFWAGRDDLWKPEWAAQEGALRDFDEAVKAEVRKRMAVRRKRQRKLRSVS